MLLIVVNDCLETATHIIHILFYSTRVLFESSVGKKVKTGKKSPLMYSFAHIVIIRYIQYQPYQRRWNIETVYK